MIADSDLLARSFVLDPREIRGSLKTENLVIVDFW